MDIKRINEELTEFLEAMQLNEMAIYYGTDRGTVRDIFEGIKKLNKYKEGMVHVGQTVSIIKEVTKQEVDKGLFPKIQQNVLVTRKYPLILVWGKHDKKQDYKKLEGHGLAHIIQGHRKDFQEVCSKLSYVLAKEIPAKQDKYGNYIIKVDNYRFVFAFREEDGIPKEAVLLTAFKRN